MRKIISWFLTKFRFVLRWPLFIIYGNKLKWNNTIGGQVLMRYSTFGDYVYIGPGTSVLWADVGNYSSIAGGCGLGGMDHEYRMACSTNTLLNPHCHIDHRIRIGRDVWIGSKVTVLQGVSIGDGAIIGAGSVVTKDVPENTIVFGSPAKYYKKHYPDEVWEKIKASNYWNHSPKEAKRILDDLRITFPLD